MPCFKGLAVSIHTPDGPIGEHSIQKQARLGRITSYIPVPKPRISSVGTAEQSTFAISITLLTPGLSVPYSTPKATSDNPYPRPQIVGHAPRPADRGSVLGAVTPYQPLTASENETIAAYIYFDGRAKEEVATLLRRGEETWVNSRWVGVPDSEGGGLAEREFLFKEVGLERWLNGLDLAGGKDDAEKVQRRKERLEKKRRKREKIKKDEDDDDEIDAADPGKWRRKLKNQDVLRYGDGDAPLEKLSDGEHSSEDDDDSDSDDDDPLPESAGQIKVALFRVLASGEIKKGEYSPQFDAHDNDEDEMKDEGNGEDIDHATSFAKPKTLDPKSISTQTVTGIDPPDKPYAVFTFLYRGEKQLQKMGILKPKKAPTIEKDAKRKSVQESVKSLGALKSGAAERFTNIRDTGSNGKKKIDDDDMSDEDDDDRPLRIKNPEDDAEIGTKLLDPEDAQRQGELSSGIQKIRLKRQHSFEPPSLSPDPGMVASEHPSPTKEPASTTPPNTSSAAADLSATPLLPSTAYNPISDLKADSLDKSMIGSPMKKARSSLSAEDDHIRQSRADALAKGLGFGFGGESGFGSSNSAKDAEAGDNNGMITFGGSLGSASNGQALSSKDTKVKTEEGMDEEL